MKYKGNQNQVSVIMPTYNCGNFIVETINSVINQTHKNWELIIVDDCSTDDTEEIMKNVILKDSRIKYYKLGENSGAAVARNYALEKAQGEFISFLDSDDLWVPHKLEVQINSMRDNNYSFSCSAYNKIDESGKILDEIIVPKKISNYHDLLKNCPGNSTVIYNANLLGKYYIPSIKKRNDYLMWLKVIKTSKELHGLQSVLGSHRIRGSSLSNNKKTLVRYHWEIYRKHEELSFIYSSFLLCFWIYKGLSRKLIN